MHGRSNTSKRSNEGVKQSTKTKHFINIKVFHARFRANYFKFKPDVMMPVIQMVMNELFLWRIKLSTKFSVVLTQRRVRFNIRLIISPCKRCFHGKDDIVLCRFYACPLANDPLHFKSQFHIDHYKRFLKDIEISKTFLQIF